MLVTLAVILVILLVLVTSLTIAIIAILRPRYDMVYYKIVSKSYLKHFIRCRRKKKSNQIEYTYEDMAELVVRRQILPLPPLHESGETMDGSSSNLEMPVYETIRPKHKR